MDDSGRLVLRVTPETTTGELDKGAMLSFVVSGETEKHLQALFGNKTAGTLGLSRNQFLGLENPINAYVTYVTVWANKDGSINFRQDRFKRDRSVARLIGLKTD